MFKFSSRCVLQCAAVFCNSFFTLRCTVLRYAFVTLRCISHEDGKQTLVCSTELYNRQSDSNKEQELISTTNVVMLLK